MESVSFVPQTWSFTFRELRVQMGATTLGLLNIVLCMTVCDISWFYLRIFLVDFRSDLLQTLFSFLDSLTSMLNGCH